MEVRIRGVLFNGLDSKPQDAIMVVNGEAAHFEDLTGVRWRVIAIKDLCLSAPIGDVPRIFETSDGLRFESGDHQAVEFLESQLKRRNVIHRLENQWRTALICAVALIILVGWIYQIGIPKYSLEIAKILPVSFLEKISKPIEQVLSRTEIPLDRFSNEQRSQFEIATQALRHHMAGQELKIFVIENENENAFVLPDGTTYVTSAFVKEASDADEILSVLLHEMGHYHYRHGVQALLENAALSVLITVLSGGTDWTSLPILVLNRQNSQANEMQADQYSIQNMKSLGKNHQAMIRFFERSAKKSQLSQLGMIPNYLSTHPPDDMRIEQIQKAK